LSSIDLLPAAERLRAGTFSMAQLHGKCHSMMPWPFAIDRRQEHMLSSLLEGWPCTG